MKFCVYCGNPLEDDARFCEECGQEQTTEQITEQAFEPTATAPVAMQGPAAASAKKSKWPLLIILISVGVVVTAAAGVLLAWGLGLFGGDEQHPTDEQSLAASISNPTFPDMPVITTTTAATTTTTRPTVKVDGNANGVEVVPEACDVLERYSVMADGGLHIRSGPATNYRSLGIVPENAVVTVYYRDGDWAYGAYNGQLGWFNVSYLLVYTEGVMDPGSEAAVDYHATFIVLSDNGVNMRSGPGTEFEVVGGVPYNYTVTSTLKFDDWVYCSFQGVEGWIKSEFLREIRLD